MYTLTTILGITTLLLPNTKGKLCRGKYILYPGIGSNAVTRGNSHKTAYKSSIKIIELLEEKFESKKTNEICCFSPAVTLCEWGPVRWSLHCHHHQQASFQAGREGHIVEVTLINNHPVDYFILKRFTPLEGLRANIFTVATNKGSVLSH